MAATRTPVSGHSRTFGDVASNACFGSTADVQRSRLRRPLLSGKQTLDGYVSRARGGDRRRQVMSESKWQTYPNSTPILIHEPRASGRVGAVPIRALTGPNPQFSASMPQVRCRNSPRFPLSLAELPPPWAPAHHGKRMSGLACLGFRRTRGKIGQFFTSPKLPPSP